MAEIGMLRDIWSAKIQLCWWHLRKAVRERLSKKKLSTTPYNAQHARLEFTFIDLAFVPYGKADATEHEGGARDNPQTVDEPPRPSPNALSIHLRIPSSIQQLLTNTASTSSTPVPHSLPTSEPILQPNTVGKLTIKVPPRTSVDSGSGLSSEPVRRENDDLEKHKFCPEELRGTIVDMLESHFCAHPLIPGYSHPSAEGIREWAVREIYEFCVKHDLREVWAYLWENWYRPGRWELWARSCHPDIPVLKTTMILESQ